MAIATILFFQAYPMGTMSIENLLNPEEGLADAKIPVEIAPEIIETTLAKKSKYTAKCSYCSWKIQGEKNEIEKMAQEHYQSNHCQSSDSAKTTGQEAFSPYCALHKQSAVEILVGNKGASVILCLHCKFENANKKISKKREPPNESNLELEIKKINYEKPPPKTSELTIGSSENYNDKSSRVPDTLKCPYCLSTRTGEEALHNTQRHCRKEHSEECRTYDFIREYNGNDQPFEVPDTLKCPYCNVVRTGKCSLSNLQTHCRKKHPEKVRTVVFLQKYNDQK